MPFITMTDLNIDGYNPSLNRIQMTLVASPDFAFRSLMDATWEEIFPGKAIVKCQHCGQWMARKTACRTCGAPVD
jgi:hypothetical protein